MLLPQDGKHKQGLALRVSDLDIRVYIVHLLEQVSSVAFNGDEQWGEVLLGVILVVDESLALG